MKKGKIDYKTILAPIVLILALCLLILVKSNLVSDAILFCNNLFKKNLVVFIYIVNFFLFAASIYFAFSKYGNIVLGKEYEKTKVSFWGWGAMMFCAGIAGDIVYFSFVDWIPYYQNAYIKSLGDVNVYSVAYVSTLWIVIWIYVVVAIALAFTLFVRKRDKYNFSESLRPILGKSTDGIVGNIINIFVLILLILGVACSQCFSVPIISSVLTNAFHINVSQNVLTVIFMLIILVIYSTSVCNGLKGIEFLSKICVYVYIVLLAYILLFGGETTNIIGLAFNEFGVMANKLILLLTDVNPIRTDTFSQDYSAFFVAYWFAWGVSTPFFIAIISKGRKIKEVILGGFAFAIPGTLSAFFILSNFMVAKQATGMVNFVDIYNNSSDKFVLIYEALSKLPLSTIALVIACLSMICFSATSLDSLSLTAAYFSYKNISINEMPDKKIRLLWAIILMAVPIILTVSPLDYIVIQDLVTLFGFVAGVLLILIVIAFVKDAKKYIKEKRI